MPQVVLITGCSSGIGLSTACMLAQDPNKRFLVYATILSPLDQETRFREAVERVSTDHGRELFNDTLFPIQMDVTDDESVTSAVAMVMKAHGRVDILVNNAGVTIINVSEVVAFDRVKKMFDINFFGMFRVTRQVLPVMKKQRSGRIINISSCSGIFAYPYLGLYAASKQAIEAFSQETAIIGRFFNIWVSVIQPGPVETPIREMIRKLGLGGAEYIHSNPDVDDVDKKLAKYFDHEVEYYGIPNMQQPAEIAAIVKEAATVDKPHFRYQSAKAHQEFAGLIFKDTTGDSYVDYQAERLKQYLK